jgi:excinuclease ABC subunit B
VTGSMRRAMDETLRRREKQVEYNTLHGITPETIVKNIDDVMGQALAKEFINIPKEDRVAEEPLLYLEDKAFEKEVAALESRMRELAGRMEFEKAADLRDRISRARRERLITSV